MKTIFKVSELPHAFLNGIARHGSKAGALAEVIGRVLTHNGRVPAAAFLSNTAESRQVVAMFPRYNDNESRWSERELNAAIPADSVMPLQVRAWPRHTPESRGKGDLLWADSVDGIVSQMFAAIERDCMASVHSASDAEGEKPTHVAAYVQTVRDALALTWRDPIARHDAAGKLQALCDRWQLTEAGEPELSIVRSIAQRELIERARNEALPTLRGYFSERAKLARLADKLEFAEKHNSATLQRAIADAMRAGIPAGEKFPSNMLAAVAADFASVARAKSIRQAPRLIANGWQQIANGIRVTDSARMHASNAVYPARHRQEFAAIAKLSEALSTRRAHKTDIAELQDAIAQVDTLRQAMDAIGDPASIADENVTAASSMAHSVRNVMLNARREAFNVGRFAPNHPMLKGATVEWLQQEGQCADMQAKADAIIAALRYRQEKAQIAERAQTFRADVARYLQDAATTPRRAAANIGGVRQRLDGWNAGQLYGQERDTLRQVANDAQAAAVALQESVTPLQEWRNGGDTPGYGDWARVNGNKVTTSRSVTISTRAVSAALAWLDAQPAQVVQHAGVDIDGYTLTSRDENGTVRVGCHSFSAESVADIRAQLAAQKVAA